MGLLTSIIKSTINLDSQYIRQHQTEECFLAACNELSKFHGYDLIFLLPRRGPFKSNNIKHHPDIQNG